MDNKNLDNRPVKRISTMDWILAISGIFILIGAYFVLRFGFGLDVTKIELSDADRVMMYILSIAFIFTYSVLIENIQRWTKLGIIKFGEKSYNRKHKDGFPVNESFVGFKYVNSKEIIAKTALDIMTNNDMDEFEKVVWFANMENRQIKYNRLIRDNRKKLSRKYRKAKQKHNDELIKKTEVALQVNRDHLQWTNDFFESINKYNRIETIDWDTKLYEIYDIKSKEYDAQELLDDEQFSNDHWIDKVRNSRAWNVISSWILPIIIGVSFIILGFMYNWKFDELLSASEKIILNLLIIYLVSKIPGRIIVCFTTTFPGNQLRPALNSAYIFQKYIQHTNKKDKDI